MNGSHACNGCDLVASAGAIGGCDDCDRFDEDDDGCDNDGGVGDVKFDSDNTDGFNSAEASDAVEITPFELLVGISFSSFSSVGIIFIF